MLVEVIISENDAGQRVDRFVRKYLPDISLSRIHFLFRNKEIKVGGRPAKRSVMLRSGDKLSCFGLRSSEIRIYTEPDSKIKPWTEQETLEYPILHEDEDLLVINKPGNVAVHPGTRIRPGHSVIEKVMRYLQPRGGEVFKPSLVHRLDRETSGVLLIAKSGRALRHLNSVIRDHEPVKKYLALVSGRPFSQRGEIHAGLRRIVSGHKTGKSVIDEKSGVKAHTSYRVLWQNSSFTLLEVSIKTGRYHQIRAHLAHEGLKIAGDARYGDFPLNRLLKKVACLNRTFLHAFSWEGVMFDGKKLHCRAELPPELERCLSLLKSQPDICQKSG